MTRLHRRDLLGRAGATLGMSVAASVAPAAAAAAPAQPPREKITDADRVYPGDGTAPLTGLLRDLRRIGFRGALSLELFNRDYWKQDALTVARTGLEKRRALVRKSEPEGERHET